MPREILGNPGVRRPDGVPEEVGASRLVASRETLLLLRCDAAEKDLESFEKSGSPPGLRVDPFAQAVELRPALLEPERGEQPVESRRARGRLHLAPQELESRRDERLRPRDLGGEVVVGARVRNPAPEDLAVFVEHDGLGRGRAEVDTDEHLHARAPARRASIIWK